MPIKTRVRNTLGLVSRRARARSTGSSVPIWCTNGASGESGGSSRSQ